MFLIPLADFLPKSVGPYVSLMLLGFVVGIFGHIIRAKWVVAVGVLRLWLTRGREER